MSDTLQRISPLGEFRTAYAKVPTPATAGIHLAERPFLGHVNLRGNPEDPVFMECVGRSLGVSLPVRPNTLSEGDAVTALWLGPDEWLVVSRNSKADEMVYALRSALAGMHVAINDLTDGQTILCLSGQNVRRVLRKGCSLDLHPDAFVMGACAQTLVAKAPVLIWRGDPLSCFNLVVRRSFAEYLVLWLQDAASEYGIEIM